MNSFPCTSILFCSYLSHTYAYQAFALRPLGRTILLEAVGMGGMPEPENLAEGVVLPVGVDMLPVPYGWLTETEEVAFLLLELSPVERGLVWRVIELVGLVVEYVPFFDCV